MPVALRALAVVMLVLTAGVAWGQRAATVDEVLSALRAGGCVIVVRHGATHADQADTDPLNLDNVAKQRQLNDKGRAQARSFGEALKAASVPIGQSYSSRFQRAVETARLIGGKEPTPTIDISEGGLVVSPDENARRVIVTHKPNILDALGKDWFDVREGEASIFRPQNSGTSTLVGRVQIDDRSAARK